MISPGVCDLGPVKLHYLQAGVGELVLCLHGFPDHAPSMRAMLEELAAAGFRAVAPFMRGYAPSTTDARTFESAALAGDVLGLGASLASGADIMLVGHDWGAVAALHAAVLQPERVPPAGHHRHAPRAHLRPRPERGPGPAADVLVRLPLPGRGLRRACGRRPRLRLRRAPDRRLVAAAAVHAGGVVRPAADAGVARHAPGRDALLPLGLRRRAARPGARPRRRPLGRARAGAHTGDLRRARRLHPPEVHASQGEDFLGDLRLRPVPGVGHWPHLEDPRRVLPDIVGFLRA